MASRVTVPDILGRKGGPKISCITAYDYSFARLIDQSDIDIILVGDSLGCVIQGHDSTIPVTLDEVIYHASCVSRGVKHALIVGDMPFLSYQISPETALLSAGRLLKEGAVAAVKLEGGVHVAGTIEKMVNMDIPVMGHVGLTPQSIHRMGGNKIQGRKAGNKAGSRRRIIEDAKAIEKAGAFSLVIEGVPLELAQEITESVKIPTIGIGSGPHCDGQVLVVNDLLGINPEFNPRFVKRYAELGNEMIAAFNTFKAEVQKGSFPGTSHSVSEIKSIKNVA